MRQERMYIGYMIAAYPKSSCRSMVSKGGDSSVHEVVCLLLARKSALNPKGEGFSPFAIFLGMTEFKAGTVVSRSQD